MKKITNNDLMKELLTSEDIAEVKEEVLNEVKNFRGGKREGSGRKLITGKVLKFTKRVTDEEARFIDYAREHHINYEDLMQG